MKDYKVNYIDLASGERLAYREAGSGGEVIVLIHGNMSSSVHYQVLMEKLEKDYKVYAPDMIGFGDSSYNRQAQSLRDFSRDIVEFIKALDLRDIYLMGWSTGGGVSMEVAAEIPGRIRKLFLQSSVSVQGYPVYQKDSSLHPIMDKRIFRREDIALDPVLVLPALKAYKSANRAYFRYVWDLTIYNKKKPSDEDYEKYLDAIMKQRNIVDVNVCLASFNISNDFNGVVKGSGRIGLIKAPVVIFHGDKDLIVPIDQAFLSKKYFGDQAELVVFKGMGHSLLTDNLDKFYKAFIDKL